MISLLMIDLLGNIDITNINNDIPPLLLLTIVAGKTFLEVLLVMIESIAIPNLFGINTTEDEKISKGYEFMSLIMIAYRLLRDMIEIYSY